MPSRAVYLYVHTTVPLHVIGDGLEVEPTKTGETDLPHASVIFDGGPGSVALDGHGTVDEPFAGGIFDSPL